MGKSSETMVKAKETYEEALTKLEESVRRLEKGELTLDDSLKAFEDGIKWARVCEERLAEAKGKIEILVKKAEGSVTTEDFSGD